MKATKYWWHFTCALTLAGLVPYAAQAQDSEGAQADITFSLTARHDSNVARSSPQRAAIRGLTQSDQRLTPSVSIDVLQPIGRHSASLSAILGYDFYRRNSRLDSERLQVDGRFQFDANFCQIGLNVGARRRQSELGDLAFLLGNSDAAVQNIETQKTFGGDISCGAPTGIRPTASISRDIGDNDNILRQRSDYRTTSYRTGIGYTQPNIGNIELYASRSETRFPNTQLRGVRDNFNQIAVGGEFQRDIGTRITANIGISYTSVNSLGGVGRDFKGVTYDLGLTAIVTPQLQVSGNFSRSPQTSLNNDASYTVDTNYGVNATYAVNDRIKLSAGYRLADREYINNFGATVLPITLLRDERLHIVSGSISYSRSQRLSLVLDGGYERRNANGTFFDYSNVFVALGVRTSF